VVSARILAHGCDSYLSQETEIVFRRRSTLGDIATRTSAVHGGRATRWWTESWWRGQGFTALGGRGLGGRVVDGCPAIWVRARQMCRYGVRTASRSLRRRTQPSQTAAKATGVSASFSGGSPRS